MPQHAPLVILCAMQAEADAIIAALDLYPTNTPWPAVLPPRLWVGDVATAPVNLVTNGRDPRTGADLIGTTPAAFATQLLINHLNPQTLLIAGAAGGCSISTTIGAVHLIDRAFHHDRRIPLPGFADYAHGPEPLHHTPQLAAAFNATIAHLSTGNALDTLDHELGFFKDNAVTVKDMETASVAWVANLHAVRTPALRSITDFYDHPTPQHQFLANFDHALSALAGSIAKGLPSLTREQPPPP